MAKFPFPVDPTLTAITVAYRNPSLIADEVLPRVSVGDEKFKYWLYPVAEIFAVPDDHVGRRSQPNEIRLSATETADMTEDFGLEDGIPQTDITGAPPGRNPVDRSAMQLSDYIALNRERRTAALLFAEANYAVGMKTQLAGNDQWSVDHADSDPIEDITVALDTPLMRPNIAIFGHEVWSKLSRHKLIVKAINGNEGDTGIVRRRAVADLFELEEIYVGQSRFNAAAPGQAATLQRCWGKHASFIYRNRMADTNGGMTFGFTAEFGTRVAGQWEDKNIGLRGGTRIRVGESLKELIVAGQAGYFIEDAIA